MIIKQLTKRLLTAVTTGILAFTVTACSTDKPASTPSNTSSDSPVTVSMFASPPSDVENLKTNWFTKYAEQKFHMNINWEQIPGSDVSTKQALELQSGNYPDIFWSGSFSPAQLLQYSQQGILIPLNNLIQNYAPDLWKAIQTVPGLKQGIEAPDGKIYGLPSYNWCWHCDYSAKMWVDKTKLTQYGLAIPQTTADFKHMLEVFKEHSVTPLTGSTDGWHSNPVTFLMNSFIYDDEYDYFYINDNEKLGFAPVQPQWKEGLKYIQSLYAEGLIDHGAFTQKNDILNREVNNKQVGAFPWGCKNCVISNYGTPESHFTDWTTIAPLKGPEGVHYSAFYGTPPNGATFAITNKASEAEQIAVMKLVNFLWTPEGTETMDFGPEGKYWTKAKTGENGLMGTQAIFNTNFTIFYNGNSMQNEGWNQMGPFYQSYDWRNGQVAFNPDTVNGSEAMLQLETMKNYAGLQPKEVYPGFVWIDPAQAQQFAMYQTNMNNYVNQWTAEFIAGSKSINNDWDTYVQGLKQLGLEQYLQMTQKVMGKPFDTSSFKQDPNDVKFLESLK